MAEPNIKLTLEQDKVLKLALEFYIRLGLGRFSEIFTQFNILQGSRLGPEKLERIRQLCEQIEDLVFDDKVWNLEDEETSIYTIVAFHLDSILNNNKKDIVWANKRFKEMKTLNKEKI